MSEDRLTPAKDSEPVRFRSADERIEQLVSDPLIAADVERYSDERVAWSAQQVQ